MMVRNGYSAEFKAGIVMEVLREEKSLSEIAAAHELSPNMLRNWKVRFIKNANRVFDESKREKDMIAREGVFEEEKAELYKKIGQLTIERDWLQRGYEKLHGSGSTPQFGGRK